MFGLFSTGSKKQQLEKKYKKLLEQSYKLSHTDRKASDELAAKAEEVRLELEKIS